MFYYEAFEIILIRQNWAIIVCCSIYKPLFCIQCIITHKNIGFCIYWFHFYFRLRLTCTCSNMTAIQQSGKRCGQVLPFDQQQWYSYMGSHGDSHWLPRKPNTWYFVVDSFLRCVILNSKIQTCQWSKRRCYADIGFWWWLS